MKFFLSYFFKKVCPTKPGYDNYHTGGCSGRDELGVHMISIDECAKRCNENAACVSFEFSKKESNLCYLSSSCRYHLSVKKDDDEMCLYEKQGKYFTILFSKFL